MASGVSQRPVGSGHTYSTPGRQLGPRVLYSMYKSVAVNHISCYLLLFDRISVMLSSSSFYVSLSYFLFQKAHQCDSLFFVGTNQRRTS